METIAPLPQVDLVDFKKEGLKYGAILSVIALLIMIGSYAAGIDTFLKVSGIFAFVPYMIIILIVGLLDLRKKNGGYMSFKQGLQFCFLAYAVAAVVTAIATYVLYNYVNPDLTRISYEKGLEYTQSMMEKFGASDADVEKAMNDASAKQTPTTGIGTVLQGSAYGLIWSFVLSCILAAIFKKEKPLFN